MESIEVIREELKRLKVIANDKDRPFTSQALDCGKIDGITWVLQREIEACIKKLDGWKLTANYTAQNFYEEKINKLIEVLEETK